MKGHAGIDPDSEIITATTVSAGNVGDAGVAADLIEDLIADRARPHGGPSDEPVSPDDRADHSEASPAATESPATESDEERDSVYGDAAYGSGEFQAHLEDNDVDSGCKTQAPTAKGGLFTKDRFAIDLDNDVVTCANEVTVRIRRGKGGAGMAYFGAACSTCPLRERCTNAAGGRTINVGIHEDVLARARTRQRDPEWIADYRATRPKVERKLGHLMRRRHGGRRARVLGRSKVDADFRLLAAAINLARLATLGLVSTPTGWVAMA